MRGKYLFILLILCIIGIHGVFADYSELIEYDLSGVASWSQGTAGTSSTTQLLVGYLRIPHIEDFKHVTSLVYTPDGTYDFGWYYPSSSNTDGATAKVFTVNEPGVLYATGTAYIRNSGGAEYMEFIFDTWTVSGTGELFERLTFPGPYSNLYIKKVDSDVRHTEGATGITEPYFGGQNGRCLVGIHQTSFSRSYKANLSITSVQSGGVVLSNITSNRNIGGIDYPSWIKVTEGEFIYLNDVYETSGQTTVDVASYPVDVLISFGYPTKEYTRKITYYANESYNEEEIPVITPTPTPPISVPNSGCGMNIELSLSKYANIFPYENITASLSIDDTSNLTSGSKITYVIDTFNFNSPLVIATFSNIHGTWHAYKNDLGIISDYDTTLSDALSENIRFSDAGYYTVSAYVDTPTGCYVYDTVSANVNPTSQVNVDFYFRDAVSGDLVGFVAATIANVGITGNVSYYGNPIGIAASRYDNISIYCDHEGYETKFFYYTVPQPPYGNVLDVPVYLTPLEAPIIYADNTVLSVNVKSAESGEGLSNAYVSADILGVECDSGWTDGNGFVSLIVPFHPGYTLLSTGRFPYNSDSRYLSLNNATSYSVDVYLSYAGTPIVTPTPSYNYTPTLTPTATDTPMPSSTVISTPLLYVHVWDADGGMSYPISSAIVTIYDGDEVDQTYKGAIMYTAYTDTAGNIEPLQIESNSAFWASISKSGYYTQIQRYRMTTGTESHIYVPLKRVGASVTVVTTQPTLVLPTPGGTGVQGGFIGWILDYFSEWFGVDNGTARILLALFIIMCSSVFVGGSLAGFGSGAGAGMGALIGGMFAFIAMCYVQFLPFWLLPIGIAFVGMAFFVWNRQEK